MRRRQPQSSITMVLPEVGRSFPCAELDRLRRPRGPGHLRAGVPALGGVRRRHRLPRLPARPAHGIARLALKVVTTALRGRQKEELERRQCYRCMIYRLFRFPARIGRGVVFAVLPLTLILILVGIRCRQQLPDRKPRLFCSHNSGTDPEADPGTLT